jgi:hypothetical protein
MVGVEFFPNQLFSVGKILILKGQNLLLRRNTCGFIRQSREILGQRYNFILELECGVGNLQQVAALPEYSKALACLGWKSYGIENQPTVRRRVSEPQVIIVGIVVAGR